jgi:hypothetical protein
VSVDKTRPLGFLACASYAIVATAVVLDLRRSLDGLVQRTSFFNSFFNSS